MTEALYAPAAPSATDHCWIAPDGTFWPVQFYGHSQFADWKLRDLTGAGGWVEDLEKLGWLHFSDLSLRNERPKFTQPQFDTIWDWYMAQKTAGRIREANRLFDYLDVQTS